MDFRRSGGGKVMCLLVMSMAWGLPAAPEAQEPAASAADVPVQEVLVEAAAEPKAKAPETKKGARAEKVAVGPLGERAAQDTPYSIRATSAERIDDLQAQSVAEALRYDPAVTSGSGSNTVGGGAGFSIRGFQTDTNVSFIDGLRLYARTPVEDKARVEVMAGPSAFLYGVGSPAGTINYVLKRPTARRLMNVTMGDYGGAQAYVHADLGGPIDAQGAFGYRFNALYVNRGDTGVENQSHERYLLSGAFDWHITPSTTWSIDYSRFYVDVQHGDNIFTLGAKVTAIPTAPSASTNYMPKYSVARDGYDRYGMELSSKLSSVFSLRAAAAYGDVRMYRHRASNKITDNAGDYTMSRNYYNTSKYTTEGQAFLDAEFDTRALHHKLTLGVTEEYTNYKKAYPYVSGSVSFSGTNNIYDPVDYPLDVSGETVGVPDKTQQTTSLLTLMLGDQIALSPRWSAVAGAAYTVIRDRTWDFSTWVSTGTESELPENHKERLTPSAALLFKPIPAVTTYLSYIEALQEGGTAPDTAANAGAVLDPYVTHQVELGAKGGFAALSFDAALFWIDTVSVYTDAATNVYNANGREKHLGGTLSGQARLLRDLTLGGGLTLMHAEVTESGDSTVLNRRPAGVPAVVARAFAEYDPPFLPGATVMGGAAYTGEQYVNATNSLSIPEVLTADVGARYRAQVGVYQMVFRLAVDNLTNADYWTTTGSSSLALGSPRTVSFSCQMKL